MGKGFNNYMTKKFFHPASKDNIKRKWMAEQKTAFEKKQQEELLAQYQKEQEVLSNRALIGDVKAKMGLSFMYDAPPGLKKKEEADSSQQEVKFEWQRKYNAPREAYAKDDDTIRDQPFGIEVRNVRCIKCRQWGHVNTDKICPLYGRNLTAEPELPSSSSSSLLDSLKEDGFALKNSVLNKMMDSQPGDQHKILSQEDEDDPEVKFLKTLTPKQKKKLLKKLNKLQTASDKGVSKKRSSKKKKKKSRSDSSDDEIAASKKSKKSSKRDRSYSSSSDSEDSSSRKKMAASSGKQGHRRNSSTSESDEGSTRRSNEKSGSGKQKRVSSSEKQRNGREEGRKRKDNSSDREERHRGPQGDSKKHGDRSWDRPDRRRNSSSDREDERRDGSKYQQKRRRDQSHDREERQRDRSRDRHERRKDQDRSRSRDRR